MLESQWRPLVRWNPVPLRNIEIHILWLYQPSLARNKIVSQNKWLVCPQIAQCLLCYCWLWQASDSGMWRAARRNTCMLPLDISQVKLPQKAGFFANIKFRLLSLSNRIFLFRADQLIKQVECDVVADWRRLIRLKTLGLNHGVWGFYVHPMWSRCND